MSQRRAVQNMDIDLKIANKVKGSNNNNSINTLTNYFLPSTNMEVDKRKSIELIQKYTLHSIISLMALSASKADFHCSSSLLASPIKHHQDMQHMQYKTVQG